MNKSRFVIACAMSLAAVGGARAQATLEHPLGSTIQYRFDSGFLNNDAEKLAGLLSEPVQIRRASWIRVMFEDVVLAPGSFIRLTSVQDGEFQDLSAETMDMWSNGSAYLNGDTVIVELFGGPRTVGNHFAIKQVAAELHAMPVGDPGLCGICQTDDRYPNNQLWSGRIMPVGCTGSVFCTGQGMVTAGHCLAGGSASVVQFNVPASNSDCSTNAPPVADQFPVLPGYLYQSAGVGNDWGVYLVGTNSLGQTPYNRYGQLRALATTPLTVGAAAGIWGYGVDTNCVRSQVQQYSGGDVTEVASTDYGFTNDVRGGNSGSGFLGSAGTIAGVVTHCNYAGCPNIATRIDHPLFVAARTALGCGAPIIPGNDACASATNIGLGSYTASTVSGTNDGVASCRPTSLSPDVWFAFTPTCSGTYRFSTCDAGTNFDTVLSVHTSCPGTAANSIACNDDSGCTASSLASQLDVALTAGSTYYIRVGGYNSAVGTFVLTSSAVTLSAPPSNDNCADATAVSLGDTLGSTYCATSDGATTCGFFSTKDVWYKFTPTCAGTYDISTCGAANFDTVLSVHSSCPGTSSSQLTCNDDWCGLQSFVSLAMDAGATYLIRVAGYYGAQGDFTLTVAREADTYPSNDHCPDALAATFGTYYGSTTCATADGISTCDQVHSHDVWYKIGPSNCRGLIRVDTFGETNYDTILSLHTGCPGTTANQVMCNDDSGATLQSAMYFEDEGYTYYIRVSGYQNATGNFQLNISTGNDNCTDARYVTDGSYAFDTTHANTDGLGNGLCLDISGDTQVNHDVWFLYYAMCNGNTTAQTCGSGFDTKIAAYPYGACPPSNPVACNDDYCGVQSRITFPVLAGNWYFVRVGGYRTAVGCGVLQLSTECETGCSGCAADYNQDGGVDGSDVSAFFDDWEGGLPCSDVNQDGGIDGSDVEAFFAVWENGGC